MSCERFEEQFSLYLYGELSAAEEEALEAHCAGCETCRAGLDRERALHVALDGAEPELPAMLLSSCRRELTAAIPVAAAARPSWRARVEDWFGMSPVWSWRQPVAALALVAIGFAGGRLVPWTPPGAGSESAAAMPVATRVREVVAGADGRVRLVLDETRQRTLDGALDEPGIRRLLMAAAQDSSDAGLRVDSVDLLRRQASAGEVQNALIAVLERDPNPGVRLKAIEGLRPFANEPAVRRVLSGALERDENPGVRGQAVDLLVEHGQKDVVDVLQRLMQHEDNSYIRSRTQRALEAINASVETF